MSTTKTFSLLLPVGTLLLLASNVLSGPINYHIKVDPANASWFDVEIVAHSSNPRVRLAMAAHPEYHDRYFRYVENFSAESRGGQLVVTNPDEAIWQIDGVHETLKVRYRINPPAQERQWRQSWKPFVTPTGGLVGDLHMLMYVVGEEKHPAVLTLDMPAGWKAASGLEPTNDPRKFTGTVELLLDSPVLIGDVKEWKFSAGGVPHTVAIWSPADAKPVDAAPIVSGIRKLADHTIRAFGKPPYPRYAFLLENGGQAALEHATSLNVGISGAPNDLFESIAHEYVHVWNLMDVRPKERIGLKYRFAEPTGVLWWSEGATIFFADLLIRRAGIAAERRTRIQRLESLIARYLSAPGYSTLSAELVSRGDSHSDLLRDNWASTHLQGEVLVSMLDLKIRDFTNGRRSIDDVQHELSSRFNSDAGIGNSDIQMAFERVCGCNMTQFFKDHISGAKQAEFDSYLALVGLRSEVVWKVAIDPEGRPAVDLRIGPMSSDDGDFKLRVTNPNSTWARAGLRTGDKLISAGGSSIRDWSAFRNWLRTLSVGDTVRLEILRDGAARTFEISLKPYDIPTVRLVELPNVSAKQRRLRDAWADAR